MSAHLDGLRGSGYSSTDSIFENASNNPDLTGITGSGNLYYNTDPVPGGTSTNPEFVDVLTAGTRHWSDFQTVDLTAQCSSCSGKGATLHKFQDILDRIDSLNVATLALPERSASNRPQRPD